MRKYGLPRQDHRRKMALSVEELTRRGLIFPMSIEPCSNLPAHVLRADYGAIDTALLSMIRRWHANRDRWGDAERPDKSLEYLRHDEVRHHAE